MGVGRTRSLKAAEALTAQRLKAAAVGGDRDDGVTFATVTPKLPLEEALVVSVT
jgi:hypothetical protein